MFPLVVTSEPYALVAGVVNQAGTDRTPEAKAAMDEEWQNLVDKSCWLPEKNPQGLCSGRDWGARKTGQHTTLLLLLYRS